MNRNLRNYFFENEKLTKINVKDNTEDVWKPTTVKILPKRLPVEHPPEYSTSIQRDLDETERLADINEFRLELAKTKLLPKKAYDLPTIRSATNVPKQSLAKNAIGASLTRSELPIIRSADNVPLNVPVLRSETNIPRRKFFSISPINSLAFLASRMRQ